MPSLNGGNAPTRRDATPWGCFVTGNISHDLKREKKEDGRSDGADDDHDRRRLTEEVRKVCGGGGGGDSGIQERLVC